MIWRLALKNILRNKKNSFVIVLLITTITFLFFIGNSILSKTSDGLKRSYTESLTGDLVVQKTGDVTMNLFGANAPVISEYFTIPVLSAYNAIYNLIMGEDEVESAAGQVSSSAVLRYGEKNYGVLICGVNPSEYFPIFPGIKLEEGSFLKNGEEGFMITAEAAMDYERDTGLKARTGSYFTFTAAGRSGFKIRESVLTGIFSYKSPGRFMNGLVIMDVQTARTLSSIQTSSGGAEVSSYAQSLLDMEDEDAVFFNALPDAPPPGETYSGAEPPAQEEVAAAADGGDWNFIIVKLKPRTNAGVFIFQLNKILEKYGARAVNWRLAAGGSAVVVFMISALFNAGLIIVSVAGVIAAVNILLISVFKRTREIGTLKAIGASDAFIRALIIGENAALGLFSGVLASSAGALFLKALNSGGLYIENEILANMFGGNVLNIGFSFGTAVASVCAALALSVISSLYPVGIAVKIEPVEALSRG
ncbi:MAG: FtsX-like permease family protein [Spirochaetaceae bacterium]|nr:FtsX-like permease family protein [Spirochaetaceae bacterium]